LPARFGVCLAIVVAVSHAPLTAQREREPERRSTIVRGRVVAAENQQPLRRALISALRPFPEGRPAFTDDEGRFEITLVSVPVTLSVTKGGYAGHSIEVTSATLKANREIEIQLLRGAAVSGRVLGNTGAPIAGVRVRARRLDGSEANRRENGAGLSPLLPGAAGALNAATDDLGEFRLSGLATGRYEVSAQRPLRPEELGAAVAQLQRTTPGARVPAGLELLASTGLERIVDVRTGDDAGPVDLVTERAEVPGLIEMPVAAGTSHETSRQFQVRMLSAREQRAGGALSGTVIDQSGEPLQGIQIRALRLQREDGRVVARDAGSGAASSESSVVRVGVTQRTTDDRGRYRLWGLPPGRYLVMASTDATPSGLDRTRGNAFPRVYYPGTPDVESAQSVRVDEGLETTGADVSFAPVRAGRIVGMARDAAGEPLIGQVRLTPTQRPGVPAVDPLVERVNFDGTFEIHDVPHGEYVLQAVGTNPGHRDEFGFAYVTIDDRPSTRLTITATVGATLEGRFIIEGARSLPMRAKSIHASTADFDRAPSEGRGPDGLAVFDDGRFVLTGLRGTMRLSAGELPSGWYLKSITIGGLDVTDQPFDFGVEGKYGDAEVVLSRSGGAIAGSVTDGAGKRATAFDALAFATERDRWFVGSRHVRSARAGANGTFDISGLPPGEYWVVAFDGLLPEGLDIPEGLDTLRASAVLVEVEEGSVAEIALRLVPRAVLPRQ
jgi:protocatechuate 3,4-dioxygenase beta subunit